MRSYAETYLADAMENLGEMMHFSTYSLGLSTSLTWENFIASGYADRFGSGSPDVVAGLSGTELALRSLETCEGSLSRIRLQEALASAQQPSLSLSPEYWCGWILAYYQWESGRTFREIATFAPIETVVRMYPTFHEESEIRCSEALERLAQHRQGPTRLQQQRLLAGLSQSQLARVSGVGIRAIQQYEQRAKDINKAQVESIMALAQTLFCRPEDILEPHSDYNYEVVGI